MTDLTDFWRPVPCGHPIDPVAASVEDGWACHCGRLLDPGKAIDRKLTDDAGAPGPVVPCEKCGCFVAIPLEDG